MDFYIISLLMIIKLTKCSMVLDAISQDTVYVSAYCPKMEYCREGTHVMCMYYNPDVIMGPLCINYVPVTITNDMVEQILGTVNEIRGKIALGDETGKDGQRLPRGYGIMRLEWDSKLATFAQVLANQCLGLKEDHCRATEEYPNPSQIITMVNFKVPDWQYFSRNTTTRGLNDEKISFSIDKALTSLHAVKRSVTDDTVNYCPILKNVLDMGSTSYLKLIYGRATHIGCGISAYTRYHMSDNNAQNIYNSVQMVCNISEGPQPSQPLYTTDPPIPDTGYSDICGCPSGFRESQDCLCEANPYYTKKTDQQTLSESHSSQVIKKSTITRAPAKECDEQSGKCKPEIAFLPIFDIQVAPPSYSDEMGNENDIAFPHGNYNQSGSLEDAAGIDEKYKELLDKTKKSLENMYPQSRFPNDDDDPKPELKSRDNTLTSDVVKFDTDFNTADDNISDINDVYKETDNSFMSLLDVLERAVQNIELDGEEKEIFNLKMKKIYETVLNTNKKTDNIPGPAQTENDFMELKNYIDHKYEDKMDADEFDDWSKNRRKVNIQSVEKDVNQMKNNDYIDRKDSDVFEQQNNGIDDRLIDIMSKKNYENHLHSKYDFKSNNKNSGSEYVYNIDRIYDKSHDYNHIPAPRKQQTIDKYHNSLETTDTPIKHEYKNVVTKNINSYLRGINPKYHTVNAKFKPNFNKIPIKNLARRTFTYPAKPKARKRHKNPAYRRIFETGNERAMQPVRTNNTTVFKKPQKVHKLKGDRFFISDRATL